MVDDLDIYSFISSCLSWAHAWLLKRADFNEELNGQKKAALVVHFIPSTS